VNDWREHMTKPGARALYSKENGEFTARVEYEGACRECGGSSVDVHAEVR
jgi:hypothetical protein